MHGNDAEPSIQFYRRDRRRSSITFNDYTRIKESLKQMRNRKRGNISRPLMEREHCEPINVKQSECKTVFWTISGFLAILLVLIYLFAL